MKLTKTPQQTAITQHIQQSTDSLLTVARAGSGKTTTLLMICEVLDGSAFLGAFNKAIAEELKQRIGGLENQLIEAGTFHSLGFRGWRTAYRDVKVVSDKLWAIIHDMQKTYPVLEKNGGAVRELTSLAKQSLFDGDEAPAEWEGLIDHYGVEHELEKGESVIEAAKEVFKRSKEQCQKQIDFDDMLWAPIKFGVELPKYDSMLIDEAQDTNAARRELAIRCLEKDGRIIAVGDEAQAIYGFSGADANAMKLISDRMNASTLPLTVSWRCAQEIIRRAQTWVPDIEWAPNAAQGEVLFTQDVEVWKGLPKQDGAILVPHAGDAVLCRNTKPLVELAFYCIRNRVPALVEGKDIGARLIKLTSKFKSEQLTELFNRLERYADEECERLIQAKKAGPAATLRDLADTVLFLAGSLKAEQKHLTADLTRLLETMFTDTTADGRRRNILLSTIHKSKGREWERVFILGENKYQPSKYAKQSWQIQQELNLCYVATTRAKNTLVHIEVPPPLKAR